MKKKTIVIATLASVLVIISFVLCFALPKIKTTNSYNTYEKFCEEQKNILDEYLSNHPELSLLDCSYGYDKKNAIKIAAICYNKKNNQASNLIVASDIGVGCLTFDSESTDVHYLNEYPLYIYEENKLEVPLFHYNKGEMIFHRVECLFDDKNCDAKFTVLEEASDSLVNAEKQ